MDDVEQKTVDFVELFMKSMDRAKQERTKKMRDEAIFCNISITLDGTEVDFWDITKNYDIYELKKEDIEKHENFFIKDIALKYIEKLTKYANNKVSFEELTNCITINKTSYKKYVTTRKKYIGGKVRYEN